MRKIPVNVSQKSYMI